MPLLSKSLSRSRRRLLRSAQHASKNPLPCLKRFWTLPSAVCLFASPGPRHLSSSPSDPSSERQENFNSGMIQRRLWRLEAVRAQHHARMFKQVALHVCGKNWASLQTWIQTLMWTQHWLNTYVADDMTYSDRGCDRSNVKFGGMRSMNVYNSDRPKYTLKVSTALNIKCFNRPSKKCGTYQFVCSKLKNGENDVWGGSLRRVVVVSFQLS